MILHGIEAPNILHAILEKTLLIFKRRIGWMYLANPPFGGKERAEVQQNFPVATSETAYLFLQHFIKMLKVAGVVELLSRILSNTDNASVALESSY